MSHCVRATSVSIERRQTARARKNFFTRTPAPMTLTDWSQDGRHLTYFSTDLSGGGLYALPLNVQGERKPIEVFRSKSQLQGPRLSPDNRFMTFVSNESGRFEIYAIRFDPAATTPAMPVQISDQGGTGMVFWRRDGKELYYLAADRGIMAVETGAGSSPFGKPTLLFRPPPEIVPASHPESPVSAATVNDS